MLHPVCVHTVKHATYIQQHTGLVTFIIIAGNAHSQITERKAVIPCVHILTTMSSFIISLFTVK